MPPSSIAAIATPTAPSALGILRCSGPLSATIFPDLKPRIATLKNYTDKSGTLLDQVVAVFYEEGKSYTGEASLELTCHGNPFILQKVLEDLLARGFTLAEPGEFTRRAFLNGRIDLTQAEAIGNLIAAHSDRALSAAHRQLAGDLGASIRSFSDDLLTLIATVEATIDFPDEDVPLHLPAAEKFDALTEKLSALRSTSRAHQLTFAGARVALVGAPNAGKSSLFNALLGRDRALVSPIAGTTRDYIEAQINLGGHLVTLIDTAGLKDAGLRLEDPEPIEWAATPSLLSPLSSGIFVEDPEHASRRRAAEGLGENKRTCDTTLSTHDQIEAAGIEKTKDQLATADLVVIVVDGTQENFELPPIAEASPFATLLVAAKADLPAFALPKIPDNQTSGYTIPENLSPLAISTKTLAGVEALKAQLVEKLNQLMPSADTLMVSARHAAALDECLEQLKLARGLLMQKQEPSLVAHHLHSALNYLGEILGRFDNEQVLDKLFHQFCIGK